MYNGFRFTDAEDIEKIVQTAYTILEEIGSRIEYPPLVDCILKMEPHRLTKKNSRICIERSLVQENFFLDNINNKQINPPRIDSCAEIYEGKYLDPKDKEYKLWNEKRLTDYIKLAKFLPDIGQASMLGCPLPEIDSRKQPLYEKYYTAKYDLGGKMGGYSVWDTSLCDSIYAIWKVLEEEYERPIEEIFNGGVYIISPLKLGYLEGEHLMWFRERGLKLFIGSLCSLGMTSPVTPAGAIAMQLSELMLASVIHKLLYGEPASHIWSSLSAADMRTMSFRYGRPEQVMMNNAMCDIAAHYGMKYWGHGGLSDAKVPSYEAGVQKAGSALAHLMKGQNSHVCAGLLSVDEVFSPVQLVLDNELTGYLKRIGRGFDISKETLAVEALEEVIYEEVPFLGCMHTVEHMEEIWKPDIFSENMLSNWLREGGIDDVKKAEKRAIELMEELPEMESRISGECQEKILRIIEEA